MRCVCVWEGGGKKGGVQKGVGALLARTHTPRRANTPCRPPPPPRQARDEAKRLESEAKGVAGEAAAEARDAQKMRVQVGGGCVGA